jgi:hypothetical protein
MDLRDEKKFNNASLHSNSQMEDNSFLLQPLFFFVKMLKFYSFKQ